jgi:hypothetical protein
MKNVRLFSISALVALCAVMFSGCLSPEAEFPGFQPGETYTPKIGVTYYPFIRKMKRLARPIPDYQGWTDERMSRDLRRMQESGVNWVIPVVDLTELNEFAMQRLQRFIAIRNELGPKMPQISFCLESEDYREQQMLAFLGWLTQPDLLGQQALLHWQGKVLLILGKGLENCTSHHPALAFRRTTPYARQWLWQAPASPDQQLALSPNGEQIFIQAGLVDRAQSPKRGSIVWLTPRKKGKTLRNALWQAASLRAPFICIASWNDFESGDFIEPNSLDGEHLFRTLTQETGRIQQR